MKPKIIVYSEMNEDVMKNLEKNCDVIFIDKMDPTFNKQLATHLPEVVGLIGDGMQIDESFLRTGSSFKSN